MPAAAQPVKTRDADRTRTQILKAAEQLFAQRGYDATSLAEIGEAAGVSRGTPSYFFGSKEDLYLAVLERMYADRNEALGPIFSPLARWAVEPEPSQSLEDVLGRCVDGYLNFLLERTTYVQIIEREALAGGERLRDLENQSTVMEDAFATLRRHARARGLSRFDPTAAVITLVALGYTPVAHRDTLLRRHGLALEDPRFVRSHKQLIVSALLHQLGPARP